MPSQDNALARARQLCGAGRKDDAALLLVDFARTTLGLDCTAATIRTDGYSLNSLNGILTLATPHEGETSLFFKFHQEEDESKGVAEYYNSKLLEGAGLPVDSPVMARSVPGEQILLYRQRTDPRLADVCRDIELGSRDAAFTFDEVIAAQERLDRAVGEKYLATLHNASRAEAAAESLHQLFFYRLVDGEGVAPRAPGGRLKSFYHDRAFNFPGLDAPLSWAELSTLRWRINGVLYDRTLGELFAEAIQVLAPGNLPEPCPAVLGHGDAHNANVWIERRGTADRLVFFDPAFAGGHLPALLAEIKPTFHNIFAHPDWLYHPPEAARTLSASARVAGGIIEITHNWTLNPLRAAFLRSKEDHVWRPLLRAMPPQENWERYIRLALFCCPTLVLNLTAGADRHTALTSALGLSLAVACGSECDGAGDVISRFIARISP